MVNILGVEFLLHLLISFSFMLRQIFQQVSNISCLESVFAVSFSLLLGYAQYSIKFAIGFILIAVIVVAKNNSQKNGNVI